MKCEGFSHEIIEGMHYIEVSIELKTLMPPQWKPVVELEPTILKATVCSPLCLYRWAINNGVLEDVFYR